MDVERPAEVLDKSGYEIEVEETFDGPALDASL